MQEAPFPSATAPQYAGALLSCPCVIMQLEVLALRIHLSATTTSSISCFMLPANSCPPQGQELVPTQRICSRWVMKVKQAVGITATSHPFPCKKPLWGLEKADKSGPQVLGCTQNTQATDGGVIERTAVSCGSVPPGLPSHLGLCKMGVKALAGHVGDCTEG